MLKLKIKIIPTEGIASGMVYLFNSLKYNGLIIPGDIIALVTPIYSPCLEIPKLKNYRLAQLCVNADEDNNWEIPMKEIEKLADKNIKGLMLVNPTNPTGLSLSTESISKMTIFIKTNNPDLIIIEDSTYAPFVNKFNSFFNTMPSNTISMFSYSKYFGTTGQRLGLIALHNRNIIDSKLLKNRTPEVINSINQRYRTVSLNLISIKFIDRILLDSRQMTEQNRPGLSTPRQTIMGIIGAHELIVTNSSYKYEIQNLLKNRVDNLLEPLELTR